jgi:hypothetical protein
MKNAGFGRLFSLSIALGLSAGALVSAQPAQARGWGSVYRTVKPSGSCSGGQKILASHYARAGAPRPASGALSAAATSHASNMASRKTLDHAGSATVARNETE